MRKSPVNRTLVQRYDEKEILRDFNIKETPARLLVLRHFITSKRAFSLRDLEQHLFFMEKSTLFRTLLFFEGKGLVHSFVVEEGIKHYALCDKACAVEHRHDEHAHFKCRECGIILCLPVHG
ncbi:MAG: Fur family transcriptional regulator, partial [Flavobacteriaceae bacterium]